MRRKRRFLSQQQQQQQQQDGEGDGKFAIQKQQQDACVDSFSKFLPTPSVGVKKEYSSSLKSSFDVLNTSLSPSSSPSSFGLNCKPTKEGKSSKAFSIDDILEHNTNREDGNKMNNNNHKNNNDVDINQTNKPNNTDINTTDECRSTNIGIKRRKYEHDEEYNNHTYSTTFKHHPCNRDSGIPLSSSTKYHTTRIHSDHVLGATRRWNCCPVSGGCRGCYKPACWKTEASKLFHGSGTNSGDCVRGVKFWSVSRHTASMASVPLRQPCTSYYVNTSPSSSNRYTWNNPHVSSKSMLSYKAKTVPCPCFKD